MKTFYILLIILLLAAVALVAICIYFFNFAIVRHKRVKKVPGVSAETIDAFMEYKDIISKGKQWLMNQKPERVEIISDDDLKLIGHFIPVENSKGTFLMMHGFGGSPYGDFSGVAEDIHNLGYNMLLIEERAQGESQGKYICFGVLESRDCVRWAEYLEERLGEEMPIFLQGISMGSSTVLMATGHKLPRSVKGVIADCGFTSPWNIFAHVLKSVFKLPVVPILPLTSVISKLIAGFGFKDYSTIEALKTNKLPILFIHGASDNFVPCYMSKENYAAAQGEKRLVIVEGAGHGTSYLVDKDKCKKALEEFLADIAAKGSYEKI